MAVLSNPTASGQEGYYMKDDDSNAQVLLGVRLDPDLHRRFKVWCAREGLKMSQVTRDLIRSWLKEQEVNENESGS
jgi:hypothetical protein